MDNRNDLPLPYNTKCTYEGIQIESGAEVEQSKRDRGKGLINRLLISGCEG
jgi:hypothetical protein